MNLLLPSPPPIQGLLPVISSLHDPSKMRLSVESAHTFLLTNYDIDVVCSNIVRRTHKLSFDRRLAISAVNSIVMSMKSKRTHMVRNCISIQGVDVTDKDRNIIAECFHQGRCVDAVRHSVHLALEPTVTIDFLKSTLHPYPWMPKENLVLVKQRESTPLKDGNTTLGEIGIKDSDTLLACMGGSFTLTVHDFIGQKKYYIPVSSCFETLGDVKEKIHRLTGFPPEYQILYHGKPQLPNEDGSTLVALGIVRPYMDEISAHLSLLIPEKMIPGMDYI